MHELSDFEDLFETAPCGYLSADATGRITKANQTLSSWIGYPTEHLVGRRFQDLLNIAGKIYYETHFAPLLRMQGFFNEVAMDLVTADGSVLPILVNAVERQDGARGTRFIRITVFNALDRRRYEREILEARRSAEQANEALRELNETLETRVAEQTRERDRAWRLSPDLLVVAEADGTLTAVNAAWTTLLGWEEHELVGGMFMPLTHPDDLDATLRAFVGISEAPLTMPYEHRLRHKDGSYRWFAWTGTFEAGRVYASGRHTTAEREQRETLRAAENALRQAQKMEAVGQLTGGIAHDFNNMLAIVVGSLDILKRRMANGAAEANARHLRLVENALEGANKAATLTHRLLAFSRQQPLEPAPVEPNKLVSGMSDLIRRTLTESIAVETVLAGGLWRTFADPGQLENAILNLAVNARDAMLEGGRLTIETANAHLDEIYAREHVGTLAGQYVLIAVTDTGSGMSPEVIAKAFDPFFSTKEPGKGTGLGLSQVYGFVKQSGGHIKIYSELGQGTTVKLYLRRYVGEMAADESDRTPAPLPRGDGRELVLVVEDEAGVRRFSVDALTELGYRVIEAENAEAALRRLEAHPDVALLFTDIVMPQVNGRKLADEALRRRPDLKVLYTTGYTRNAVVHNGVLDPGVHLIGKPFTVEQLARKVADVLDDVAKKSHNCATLLGRRS